MVKDRKKLLDSHWKPIGMSPRKLEFGVGIDLGASDQLCTGATGLCGMLRRGSGERGLVNPNKRAGTGRSARKGPSHPGFAAKAASRTFLASAVALLLSLGSLRTTCGLCDRNAPVHN
jgi:hypothetical protein